MAEMHRDAAERCPSSNFYKAQCPATAATEADTLAGRHATQALDLCRRYDERAAERNTGAAAEEAVRSAKHAADQTEM